MRRRQAFAVLQGLLETSVKGFQEPPPRVVSEPAVVTADRTLLADGQKKRGRPYGSKNKPQET